MKYMAALQAATILVAMASENKFGDSIFYIGCLIVLFDVFDREAATSPSF